MKGTYIHFVYCSRAHIHLQSISETESVLPDIENPGDQLQPTLLSVETRMRLGTQSTRSRYEVD
jgi:hypothetical protein